MIDRTYEGGIRPEQADERFALADDDEEEQRRAMSLAVAAFGAVLFLLVMLVANWVC
ncbi:hypothetical protein [Methylomagnum sp.]